MPRKRLIQIGLSGLCLAAALCLAFPMQARALNPSDYYSVSYSGSLSGSQVTAGGSLDATVTGSITCIQSLGFSLSDATITVQVIAQGAGSGAIVLNSGFSVTMGSIPSTPGGSVSDSETMTLSFPADMAPGQYSVTAQVMHASVNGIDVTSALPSSMALGEVTVLAAPVVLQEYLTIGVSGNGTTDPSPGSYQYDQGSVVSLEAIPAPGWKFDNWTGDVADSNSARTRVDMDADKSVTANFSRVAPPTTTTKPPPTTTSTPPTTTTITPPTTSTITPPPTTITITPPPTTTTAPPTTTTTAPPPTTSIPPVTTTETGTVTVSVDVSGDVIQSGEFIGKFTAPVTLSSSDDKGSVTIPAGTTGTMSDGKTISSITVALPEEPPSAPPTGENIVSSPYEFGPSGAHFSPPITMTISYDPAKVAPGTESSLVVAYYSLSDAQWITVGGVVDTANHTITVLVDHFTAFAVFEGAAATAPPQTARTFISNISLVRLNGTGADISWTTGAPSGTQVEYWAGLHQFTPLDDAMVMEHSVHISGLEPGSVYTFKLMSRDSDGNLNTLVLSASDTSGTISQWLIWGWAAGIPAAVLLTLLASWKHKRREML